MINLIILEADLDSGEGEVLITSEFKQLHGLLKADILQDWIGLLNSEYEEAYNEFLEDVEYSTGIKQGVNDEKRNRR